MPQNVSVPKNELVPWNKRALQNDNVPQIKPVPRNKGVQCTNSKINFSISVELIVQYEPSVMSQEKTPWKDP